MRSYAATMPVIALTHSYSAREVWTASVSVIRAALHSTRQTKGAAALPMRIAGNVAKSAVFAVI